MPKSASIANLNYQIMPVNDYKQKSKLFSASNAHRMNSTKPIAAARSMVTKSSPTLTRGYETASKQNGVSVWETGIAN
jgi:hypothetical protein